jgi:hypothetical protein
MLIDQFTTKYKGRFVDYDHFFGAQCVDLMRQYCLDVRGVDGYIAIPQTGAAKNIFYNFKNNKYFNKVLNSPTNAPKKGDIVFFGTYPFLYGLSGHVAVCESADQMNLLTFDQNYPTGTPCHFQKHSYKGCLGWLTPR